MNCLKSLDALHQSLHDRTWRELSGIGAKTAGTVQSRRTGCFLKRKPYHRLRPQSNSGLERAGNSGARRREPPSVCMRIMLQYSYQPHTSASVAPVELKHHINRTADKTTVTTCGEECARESFVESTFLPLRAHHATLPASTLDPFSPDRLIFDEYYLATRTSSPI